MSDRSMMYLLFTLAEVMVLTNSMSALSWYSDVNPSAIGMDYPDDYTRYEYTPVNKDLAVHRNPPIIETSYADTGNKQLNEDVLLQEIIKELLNMTTHQAPLPDGERESSEDVRGSINENVLKKPTSEDGHTKELRRSLYPTITLVGYNLETDTPLETNAKRFDTKNVPEAFQQAFGQRRSRGNGREGRTHSTGALYHAFRSHEPQRKGFSYEKEPLVKSSATVLKNTENEDGGRSARDSKNNRSLPFRERQLSNTQEKVGGVMSEEFSKEMLLVLDRPEVAATNEGYDSSSNHRNSHLFRGDIFRPRVMIEMQSNPLKYLENSKGLSTGIGEEREKVTRVMSYKINGGNAKIPPEILSHIEEIQSTFNLPGADANQVMKLVNPPTKENEILKTPTSNDLGKRHVEDGIPTVMSLEGYEEKPRKHLEDNEEVPPRVNVEDRVSVLPGVIISIEENDGPRETTRKNEMAVEPQEDNTFETSTGNKMCTPNSSQTGCQEEPKSDTPNVYRKATKSEPRKISLTLKGKIELIFGENEENFHSNVQLHGIGRKSRNPAVDGNEQIFISSN